MNENAPEFEAGLAEDFEGVEAEHKPLPKADPETLALRAKPSRAIRFKRGVIIGAFGLGSTALVGVAWFALKPTSFHLVASGNDAPSVDNKRPPEALAGAPTTYSDIPKLGPPLPGDLGRPILDAQRSGLNIGGATDRNAGEAQRAEQAAEAERQRIAAEIKAAREAGVMVASTGTALHQSETPANPANAQSVPLSDTGQPAGDAVSDPNGQQHKQAFVKVGRDGSDINPHSLVPAPSPWTLSAGSIIAASLVTGINSDLPGFVTAQVTENAYDSVTGKTLLIPQGSRLIGQYDSVVAFGQRRALLVWQRIILPDGSSIDIDNMPATDTAGYSGLADKVDYHSWALFKGVALSTLLGVGTQLSFGSSESDLVRAIRESAQQNADRAGQQITSKNLDIQPTITIRPGWPLRIMVHKDIIMRRWRGGQ